MRLILRDGHEGDYAYCASTWVRSAVDPRTKLPGFTQTGTAPMDALRGIANACIRAGKLIVACSEDEPDALFCWAVGADKTLWWAYVAHDFRGLGLGRRLKERFS